MQFKKNNLKLIQLNYLSNKHNIKNHEYLSK